MNRVIKFRAWDKHNKEMTTVNSWLFSTDEIDADNNMGEPKMTYHYDIMQFTGLLDKNGNDIYEGDIVRLHYGSVYIIEFVQKLALYSICRPAGHVASYPFVDNERCEVIGNIHENPELIK